MVGRVRAGSDSSVVGRRTTSEGARHEDGIVTVGMPAPSEGLKVVHGKRRLALWEDRWSREVVERCLWRESFAFNARICAEVGVAIFVRVIFRIGVV
jgi:hypothetical protein